MMYQVSFFIAAKAGVVPGDDFTLQERDVVEIGISGVGRLRNEVAVV